MSTLDHPPALHESADSDDVLRVTDLSKTFYARNGGSHDALISVSFNIPRGTCLAVVGESGSGKTTAARIVAGLETPTSGTVQLRDRRAAEDRRSRHPVQMVFQDPYGSLDPRQRIDAGMVELLTVSGATAKANRRERMLQLLEQVGLDERHAALYPPSLSGGQRQRVAIARALALDPVLLILDEAVSALDVSVQAQVLNLLSDIRAEMGISYLFVSHDLGVVRQVSDTCLVLEHGHTVEQGSTMDVLDDPQHPYTRALLDAVPRPGWQPSRRAR